MPEDHTAVNIQEALSEGLQQWKLAESQLVGITTDSGSNVKLACELLIWTRLSCFGHNLNLAVEKGLNDSRVNRAIRLCKYCCHFLLKSDKAGVTYVQKLRRAIPFCRFAVLLFCRSAILR